ncbi:MAG TPA: S1/P1 nuclease [Steroidobacteraceae bacterium]|jgi:hypothetical protein|nr:S1/P1 nuclease [Steroidobacteraceae bacterium]
MRIFHPSRALQLLIACVTMGIGQDAQAWGDEGHAVVALIAEHYLQPTVRERVRLLLEADSTGLVAERSMAGESVWADRYRDSDRDSTRARYEATRRWHYVDIELDDPSVPHACFGRPLLPAGTPASAGAAGDCVVDKIDQFQAELSDTKTSTGERRIALQFLLHLVGDLHQPLHAADQHDQGGNLEQVDAPGLSPQNLHRYWDVEFVQALGVDPRNVASMLIDQISPQELASWQRGSASDWAMESFAMARRTSFGLLPAAYDTHRYHLSAAYMQSAAEAVRLQLKRAGVRLALILNRSLG